MSPIPMTIQLSISGGAPFHGAAVLKPRAAYIGFGAAGVTPAGQPPRRRRYKFELQK
jgi:hypothetical protein